MLDQEYKYFKDHHKDLLEKFEGRYVVIQGESVIGHYGTEIEAYNETKKTHALGTFLIQKVSPNPESHSQTFHSRVIFQPHSH